MQRCCSRHTLGFVACEYQIVQHLWRRVMHSSLHTGQGRDGKEHLIWPQIGFLESLCHALKHNHFGLIPCILQVDVGRNRLHRCKVSLIISFAKPKGSECTMETDKMLLCVVAVLQRSVIVTGQLGNGLICNCCIRHFHLLHLYDSLRLVVEVYTRA